MTQPVYTLLLVVCCLGALGACQDPGCIRNSECGEGYYCKNSACVPVGASDAGSQPSSSPDAAVTHAPPDAGTTPLGAAGG